MKSAFLKLALVAVSTVSALNTHAADSPAAPATRTGDTNKPGTIIAAMTNAVAPAVLPGKGVAQYPFLYAGEWDTRKPQEQSILNGEMVAFKPSKTEYTELARVKVASTETWAHPVLAAGRIFIKDSETVGLWTLK